jgi:hypothetical protein
MVAFPFDAKLSRVKVTDVPCVAASVVAVIEIALVGLVAT